MIRCTSDERQKYKNALSDLFATARLHGFLAAPKCALVSRVTLGLIHRHELSVATKPRRIRIQCKSIPQSYFPADVIRIRGNWVNRAYRSSIIQKQPFFKRSVLVLNKHFAVLYADAKVMRRGQNHGTIRVTPRKCERKKHFQHSNLMEPLEKSQIRRNDDE